MVAISLCVALGGLALVLDQLWLDMAREEAQTSAEMCALAAARELADDDLLRKNSSPLNRIAAAKQAALSLSEKNLVAGTTAPLSPFHDVAVGDSVFDPATGQRVFLEQTTQPHAARVVISRTHAGGNPVSRFLSGLTGHTGADVRAAAVAEINPYVVGVQTLGTTPAPVLPIGILYDSPTAATSGAPALPTWKKKIEEWEGSDQFGFDRSTQTVTTGADGIPEIDLTLLMPGVDSLLSNAVCLHVSGVAHEFPLDRQIRYGWDNQDLEAFDGRFMLDQGPRLVSARESLGTSGVRALREVTGQNRVVWLYRRVADARQGWLRVEVMGLAAGRILRVETADKTVCRLVFQPAVLATRHAVATAEFGDSAAASPPHRYVHKLKLAQ